MIHRFRRHRPIASALLLLLAGGLSLAFMNARRGLDEAAAAQAEAGRRRRAGTSSPPGRTPSRRTGRSSSSSRGCAWPTSPTGWTPWASRTSA